MRRNIVLAVLIAAGAVSMAVAAAYQQTPSEGGRGQAPRIVDTPKVVEVEKLKENLYVLRGSGGGGNTAVFVQAAGVTVVDTKNPGWGRPILEKIKELTDKPVTTIINTHTHGDHVSGNVEFPVTVDIVTHENTRANMEKMAPVTGFAQQPTPPPNIFKENNGRGLPRRTFKDRMTLGTGADQLELYYFGRGHTNGDALVVFPSLRVVHFGDLFARKSLPIMDANNGGSGVAYPETLKKAHAGLKNIDVIITGHSTQMTMNDLREYAEFLHDFVTAVREGKMAGQTVDQIAASWKIPEKYTGYTASEADRVRANVQVVFDEIK